MTEPAFIEPLLREMDRDRWFAHEKLFPHRHRDPPSPAHRDLVADLHSSEPRRSIEGFRGFAKSTYMEEAVVVRAGFRHFRHLVILGASFGRACERLMAIKSEFISNSIVQYLFLKDEWQKEPGHVWQEGKIVFWCSGRMICIQAIGRDQSMLGIKWADFRPDAFVCDDVEEADEQRSDVDREASWLWHQRTFLPALDDPLLTWGRYLGTRRGKGSHSERLEQTGVPVSKYPIEYPDPQTGERRAMWPARRPLEWIDQTKRLYRGAMAVFMEEYMCQTSSQSEHDFTADMIVVRPRERVWEATYAFIDPASTVNRNSATTGWAVWSWLGSRLIVWEAGAERLLPDKVVELAYRIIERWGPIWLGVEKNGLNQFLMQPLRQEQLRRGMAIVPIKPVDAGVAIRSVAGQGKIPFIRALQPFFAAHEVELAAPLPDFVEQLLSFPHPPYDAPNALAYALTLRPGQLIYDGFGPAHIAEGPGFDPTRQLWLAVNAGPAVVTAAALQHGQGVTRVLADWACEGSPGEVVPHLVREVGLAFRSRLAPKVCLGPTHFERWSNTGVAQAFKAVPLEVEAGTSPLRGRDFLREEFGKLVRGEPAVRVSRETTLTLNALAGGYSRPLRPGNMFADEPEPGIYRMLMEGVESCLGRMAIGADEFDAGQNWAYTASGQRYRKYGGPSQWRN